MQISEMSKQGWAIVGVVAVAVLFVLRSAAEALLGKYILRLLRIERDSLQKFLEDQVLHEKEAAAALALSLATKHEATMAGILESIKAHGLAIHDVAKQTQSAHEMASALGRLASAQETLSSSVEKLVVTVARMEEREKMRVEWDGRSERRQGPPDRRD